MKLARIDKVCIGIVVVSFIILLIASILFFFTNVLALGYSPPTANMTPINVLLGGRTLPTQ